MIKSSTAWTGKVSLAQEAFLSRAIAEQQASQMPCQDKLTEFRSYLPNLLNYWKQNKPKKKIMMAQSSSLICKYRANEFNAKTKN